MVGIEKKRETHSRDEHEMRALLRVTSDMAYAISSGVHSAPEGGAVNLERVVLSSDYRYSATLAHNPNLTKSSSGVGMVWMSIPKADESKDHQEEALASLKKLRRKLDNETEDFSKN